MTSRRDREGPIHRAIISWLRVVLPEAIIFHAANESRRPGRAGHVERALNAANGVLPGVPDIIGLTETGAFFMEVKAPGGTLSAAQRDFRDRLASLGYDRWAVVRSVDDARAALASWGIPACEAGSVVYLQIRGGVK